ncbi:MAG: glycosyltransferase, partial [Deltaproteobacteria bacterium]|nr:glycosyltransferase [Deltaproteobacteria bacterium]
MFNFKKNIYTAGISKIHQIGLSCNPLPPVAYGGIETIITNLSRGLVEKGIPVICYSPLPFKIKGVEHYPTLKECTLGPKEGVFLANTEEHLKKIVQGINENWEPGDIIHLHHPEQYPYLCEKLKKKWFKNYRFLETAHWTRVALGKNIAYPSQAIQQAIKKPGKLIFHGIDLSLFKPQPNQQGYILYAGRVTKDKGVHIGAEAAAEYGIEFRVAGPLSDREYAATFMDKVNYLGELESEALASQYQGALALVYMTKYTEPFGLSVVEAMACGTPVITTGRGGTGETVVNGETGFFCQTKAEV